jgi:hypothetical protein
MRPGAGAVEQREVGAVVDRDVAWSRPPGRRMATAVAVVALFTCFTISVPGSYFFPLILAGYAWLGLGGVWAVRLLLALTVGRQHAARDDLHRWSTFPVAVLLMTLLSVSDAPMRVRFEVSRPALEAAAAEALEGRRPEYAEHVGWIGLLPIQLLERVPGAVRFQVADAGFLDPAGFVFSPGADPPVIGEDIYDHLTGPWWLWVESW